MRPKPHSRTKRDYSYDGVRRVSGLRREPSVHKTRGSESTLLLQGGYHLFQWDVGISVGFFKETTGSLRHPETRRTPSYLETI